MPPAGVTDTLNEVYGEGDALDASHSWTFDENNNTGDLLSSEGCDSDADHFFIDFDNLFAWLEGDQPISPTIHKDVLQANQTEESTLYGKPFSQNVRGVDVSGATFSVPLEVEEHAHLQCTSSCELDVSNFKDGSDSNSPSEASKCPISFGTGMSHSLNWLSMSSSGHKNSLTDSVEPFEYQQLHTRCSETLSPEKYVYDFICDSQYSEPGYNSRKEPVQGNSNLSEIAVVSCNNKRSVASPNHPQSSLVADSSYFNVLDRCSFGRVHNDTRASAILDTGSDGNSFSIALDSSNDPSEKSPTSLITESRNVLDSCLQNIRDGELCSDWAPEMSRNVQPNLLATVNSSPEVYAETSAENTSMQFLPCHLSQSFILSDKQNMANGSDTRHMPTGHWTVNKVQPFLLHEGTFFNPGSSLPDLSCNGTNLVETINPISASRKKQKIDSKDGITTVSQKQNHVNQILSEGVSEHYTAGADEDLDVYIVNDSSNLNLSHCPLVAKKSFVVPPPCGFSVSCYPQLSSSRVQAADENLTFQIALQDLAQPKSEASPPEGVLAVPLLRHQRIALSWMIQKETLNPQCSGGILADDQGLGKTVSTIALILKERSPSPKSSSIPNKGEYEALNLDEDDDFSKSSNLNHVNPNIQIIKQPIKSENVLTRQKGRPGAGTLVVCPTSVLRQWADELKNKVTSEANLSFLIYHGSNRTRDPLDIVKYDVVLATYSIVSMEVPVQAVSERSDGKCRSETMDKERKNSSRSLKNENIVGNSLLESTGRPLARVTWFRVILDEAQTIKNHRTQVARACWGLRAKRRWCLSGTPIQNAVDDLYSYFRFLKHEPFSVYNSFCSKIKAPISKDPEVGYKKLQAVLKTIMLRRTKGEVQNMNWQTLVLVWLFFKLF